MTGLHICVLTLQACSEEKPASPQHVPQSKRERVDKDDKSAAASQPPSPTAPPVNGHAASDAEHDTRVATFLSCFQFGVIKGGCKNGQPFVSYNGETFMLCLSNGLAVSTTWRLEITNNETVPLFVNADNDETVPLDTVSS